MKTRKGGGATDVETRSIGGRGYWALGSPDRIHREQQDRNARCFRRSEETAPEMGMRGLEGGCEGSGAGRD
jgi:hypothetical protein